LRGALGELRCVASQRLVRRGVSMSHFHLMSMLERHGQLPMSRIADLLDISVSNATGLVDRMEERGLVGRARVSDDRRVVLVSVTDTGRRAMADLELFRDEVVAQILGRLDDRQLARLVAAVGDLRTAVESVLAETPDLLTHDQKSHVEYPDARAGGTPTHR